MSRPQRNITDDDGLVEIFPLNRVLTVRKEIAAPNVAERAADFVNVGISTTNRKRYSEREIKNQSQ